ncbi:MAG: PLDc N-terminal domain-containing protein [Acidimicrobiales bacterium]
METPSTEVRGWKLVWVLTFFVQPIGPILYFLTRRRPPVPARARSDAMKERGLRSP